MKENVKAYFNWYVYINMTIKYVIYTTVEIRKTDKYLSYTFICLFLTQNL